MAEEKIRVLLGKIGLDGHDRGIRMVAAWLRNAGMEIVYLGTHQSPEVMVSTAIEEDVDVIGLSFQGADHVPRVRQMVEEMKKQQVEDLLLVVGGNIPKRDIPALKEMGVDEVFVTGTPMAAIMDFIRDNAGGKKAVKQV